MSIPFDQYDLIVGLELHVQLNTKTKAFSPEAYTFGSEPNTQTSPISLGHPGTLPVLNKEALDFAIKMGLACDCDIREYNLFARKNYFYADLPKGYQITQFDTPICNGGYVTIKDENEQEKQIRLTRIHLEEDTGKSIHDIDPFNTLIDLNRAGVPLIEIVSEPDFRSAAEAYNYLQEVRRLVRYLEISNGNMEEGSLRCDANISVKPKTQTEFGTRVEVKNMNSMTQVKNAITYEFNRQVTAHHQGEQTQQETRLWNAAKQETQTMRSKEDAHDYRYFTEPDIPPVIVSQEHIDSVQATLPILPKALIQILTQEHQLSEYDAENLVENKGISQFYLDLIDQQLKPKAVANWIMGPIKSYLNEQALDISQYPISLARTKEIISLISEDKVSFSQAVQKLHSKALEDTTTPILNLAKSLNIIQESNDDEIKQIIQTVLDKYPDKVAEFRNGKKGVQGLFMGEIMRASGGKFNPKVTAKLLNEALHG